AQTAGGQHSKSISFDTEPNELPLIREGCAMRALIFVDQEIFAPGVQARSGLGGKNVA
ncbi:sugar kinase, partial [Mesorhizobium sp. M7A.F.Ca.AU.002.02.1.1]